MKNIILIFGAALLIVSCSQKQFSFRKKVAVEKSEVVTLKSNQNEQSFISNPGTKSIDIPTNQYQEPLSFIEQTNVLSNQSLTTLPDDTIRKKYKFDDDSKQNNPNKESQENNYYEINSKYDTWAKLAFGLGLGTLIFSILAAVPAVIFGIKGLKSKRYKTLAIIGLVLGGLFVLGCLFYIFILFMIIGSSNQNI